jgi:hypothetical protein
MIAEALGLLILPPGTWGNVDDMVLADVDRYLELVLNAAGTSLRNYSMQRSLDNMRGAMRQALVCRLFLLTDEAAANTILRASGSSLDVFPAHEQEVILQVIAGVRKAALEQC